MKISVYQLKPQFQRLLSPLLHALQGSGITPNQITLFSMTLCLLYGGALAMFADNKVLWWLYPFAMLLRMALNAIDGMYANASGMKTQLGALLNEICDVISDLALYLPLILLLPVHPAWIVAVLMLAMLSEFAGVLGLSVGAARGFQGPMGKSDRAVLFGLLSLAGVCAAPASWISALLALASLLSVCTVWNRLSAALKPQDKAQDGAPDSR
jgi:CDP-diacylglycerol--glycerol-3-phosphate 3-phosphatidyltransferase